MDKISPNAATTSLTQRYPFRAGNSRLCGAAELWNNSPAGRCSEDGNSRCKTHADPGAVCLYVLFLRKGSLTSSILPSKYTKHTNRTRSICSIESVRRQLSQTYSYAALRIIIESCITRLPPKSIQNASINQCKPCTDNINKPNITNSIFTGLDWANVTSLERGEHPKALQLGIMRESAGREWPNKLQILQSTGGWSENDGYEDKPEKWKPVEFDNYSRSKPKTEWIDPNKGYLADETYNAE